MTIPNDLLDGYRRFRGDRYVEWRDRYRALATSQAPRTMIIGCADSRVDPVAIFSAGPGQLFVVRNVAAIAPPCEDTGLYHGTSAAIEFAVSVLEVENIVVLGHGMCGGVAAAFSIAERKPVGRFISPWVGLFSDICVDILTGSEGLDESAMQKEAEHRVVERSLTNLMTFPMVADAVQRGRLKLHGAWFSIAEGELHWLDPETGTFDTVPE